MVIDQKNKKTKNLIAGFLKYNFFSVYEKSEITYNVYLDGHFIFKYVRDADKPRIVLLLLLITFALFYKKIQLGPR